VTRLQRLYVGVLALLGPVALGMLFLPSASHERTNGSWYQAYGGFAAGETSGPAPTRVTRSIVRSIAGFTFRDTTLAGANAGEPSLAVDKSHLSPRKGAIYVTTLTHPDIWHSYDGGATWSSPVTFNTAAQGPGCKSLGGGDEDVITLPNGNVVVADLEVADNSVQVSTDGAQTFGNCFGTGPESDRPWFGSFGSSFVYLAYHDFVGEVPVVCSSIDGGTTFPICNHAFANPQVAQCAENTVPARPLVADPVDGSLHFMYSCSTALENLQHPPYGPLHDYYVANSFGPYVMGQPAGYTTATIFQADTNGKAPNYANIFSTMRSDSAGNYYAVFNGTADDNHVLTNPYHVYLTVSTDKGVTWSTPVQVDNDQGGGGTHVFADIMPTTPGKVDIVWLGAPATGEPNGQCGSTAMVHNCMDGTTNVGMQPGGPVPGVWNVYMAQSTDALSASPTFTTVAVTTDGMHNGEICTNGIVCGSSDRSLLDYISVDVDCTGNAHIAYTRNAQNGVSGAKTVHEVDQLTGPTLPPPPTCSGATAATVHGAAQPRLGRPSLAHRNRARRPRLLPLPHDGRPPGAPELAADLQRGHGQRARACIQLARPEARPEPDLLAGGGATERKAGSPRPRDRAVTTLDGEIPQHCARTGPVRSRSRHGPTLSAEAAGAVCGPPRLDFFRVAAVATSFWHPFSNMSLVRDRAVSIVRGEGSTVWDADGRAYLDATAALWYCNVGHGRADLAEAAARQLRELASYHAFGIFTTPPTEELAARLASLAPGAGSTVFFTAGGGSDAIDTAGKLARAYWIALERPEKQVIVSRSHAYHGVNAYGTSLGGIPAVAAAFGPLVPTVAQVPWDDAAALERTIDELGADAVAAFVCEPVVGAGGVLLPPEGYLDEVAAICRRHDVLFVADEVITGFGRLGEWFGVQRFGLEPDLITCAKGVTSGYVPLGAVIANSRVSEPFWGEGSTQFLRHGYTYSGHATACAVGLANLDVLEREGLLARSRELEAVLERAVRPLEAHPLVGEVRAGLGLLAGVEIAEEALAERPDLPDRVFHECLERGVICRAIRGVAMQISPPLVITEQELETIGSVLGDSLDAVG
jgi:putrescine---pyruvate transaminase